MRITQNMVATQVLGNITGSLGRLAKAQEQLASTKRINRASDDPLGSGLVMRFQATKEGLEGFQRATDAAQEALRGTATPLERVTEILQQTREVAVRGSSDTMSGSRGPLAEEVNQLLEELLSQANSRFRDRYIFGGTQTGTTPYSASRNATGQIAAVTANPLGIDGTVNAEVASGFLVQSNLPGSQAFTRTVDLFATLVTLRDALTADDTAGIAATMDTLSRGIDQVNTASGVVGVAVQRLEAIRTRNQEDLTRVEALRSKVQDANITEVYVELQKLQNAFDASLAAGAKAMKASLVDYLQ
jgi:flagellar hook-associated protein 3 FlgL